MGPGTGNLENKRRPKVDGQKGQQCKTNARRKARARNKNPKKKEEQVALANHFEREEKREITLKFFGSNCPPTAGVMLAVV